MSWSGTRSRTLARAIRDWLPDVLHNSNPWLSDKDAEAGGNWLQQLSAELVNSEFAVLCLTRENLHSDWMAFEAGACVNHLDEKRVCPVLLDIQPGELMPGPFGQFQAVGVDKDGLLKLVHAINKAAQERMVEERRIDRSFEKWWPELEHSLAQVKLMPPPRLLGKSAYLTLFESFSDFLATLTDMIENANHRFLVLRRYSAGISQGEEEYFEATKKRLLSRKLPVYRRLVSVETRKNVQQVKWMLENLHSVGPLEIKVWSGLKFPANYEMIIGDNMAVLAFSSGGAPQRGIIVSDERLVEHLVRLYDLYWNDRRAVSVKSSEALALDEMETAKSQVQLIYENLSPQ